MSTTTPKCGHCHDTGSLSKQLDGQLDCGHCDVATVRAKLDGWCQLNIPKYGSQSTAAWLIYQHGYVAGWTESQLFG